MRSRALWWILICLTVWAAPGCDRTSPGTPTAEIDEPAYRRGKDLLRQGRNQEALGAFLGVIEQRGDDAPESHLEVAVLYHRHIRDPIAAIYHFRKFLERKPNSPQADLVKQQISAAMRDFARSLPAQPHENQASRSDLLEVVERLQQENLELKDQNALLRAHATSGLNTGRPAVADISMGTQPPERMPAYPEGPASIVSGTETAQLPASPISRAPDPAQEVPRLQPPTRPADGPAAAPTGARRHLVARGDTLYSLAQRYYSNRSRWRDIYAANRSRMSNENDLRVGTELVIPP